MEVKCSKCYLEESKGNQLLKVYWPKINFDIKFTDGKECSFCLDSMKYRNQKFLDKERDVFFLEGQGPIFVSF